MSANHDDWMLLALEQAKLAEEAGEVPVGAVIVREGELLAVGFNQPISGHDPTAHAEIVALRSAAEKSGNYRLSGCDLYVTIEPCSMCLGAMIHARIAHLYFGAREPRAGAAVSNLGLHKFDGFNHRLEIDEGFRSEECSSLIQGFFRQKRG